MLGFWGFGVSVDSEVSLVVALNTLFLLTRKRPALMIRLKSWSLLEMPLRRRLTLELRLRWSLSRSLDLLLGLMADSLKMNFWGWALLVMEM